MTSKAVGISVLLRQHWCIPTPSGPLSSAAWLNVHDCSVGASRDSWSRGPGFDPHSLPVWSVSVSCGRLRQNVMVSPLCLCATGREIATRSRDSSLAEEDVKKPTKSSARAMCQILFYFSWNFNFCCWFIYALTCCTCEVSRISTSLVAHASGIRSAILCRITHRFNVR